MPSRKKWEKEKEAMGVASAVHGSVDSDDLKSEWEELGHLS